MSFTDGYILEVLKLEVKPEKEDHITPHERRKVEHLLFGSDKNVKGTFRAVLAPTVEEGITQLKEEIKRVIGATELHCDLLCFEISKKEIQNSKFFNSNVRFVDGKKYPLN